MRHSGAMSASELRFAALGPLRAWVDGEPVDLGPAKQRAVLATLLLAAPDAVTVERLTDAVWPAGGPDGPAGAGAGWMLGWVWTWTWTWTW